MNSKSVVVLFVVTIAIGTILGIYLNLNNIKLLPSSKEPQKEPGISQINTVSTKIPTLTFPPLSEVVKSIDAQNITINGTRGDMTVPKNASIIKVFQRKNGQLIPASFEDVKIGQNVTLKIITPGKSAELIIEP